MNSLRRRLTVTLASALTLLALGGASAFYPLVRKRLIAEFDYALAAKAQALTRSPQTGREGVNLQFTDAALPEFSAESKEEFFEVVLLDAGGVLARSASLQGHTLAPYQRDPWNAKVHETPVRATSLRFSHSTEAELLVVLARNRSGLDSILRQMLLGTVVAVIAIIVLAMLLIRRIVNYGLKPVDELAAGVARASLESRLEIKEAPLELQPIVREVNELLSRLQSAFERERCFTSNVAHELATPVAELRSVTDLALKWCDDPAMTAPVARSANEIARQMERVLRVLLALSRSESGREQLRVEALKVDALVTETIHAVQSRLLGKQIQLSTRLSPVVLESDRTMLRAILFNVFDNAVEYTPVGGTVVCELTSERLLVRNTQSNLTSADLPHLCDPFWRKDLSRTDSTHAGLGLTLVQSYAQALDMDFTTTLEGPEMFCAELRFPRKA